MNYKGNAFSVGTGAVSDAVFHDGKIYFLQKKRVFVLRAFEASRNAFLLVDNSVSYADKCWFFDGAMLEQFGTRLSVSDSGNAVVAQLS